MSDFVPTEEYKSLVKQILDVKKTLIWTSILVYSSTAVLFVFMAWSNG